MTAVGPAAKPGARVRRLRAAGAALGAAVLLVTACVGGPAADRAGINEQPPAPGPEDPDDSPGPTPDPGRPTETAEPPSAPEPTEEPDPPPAEGTATVDRVYPLDGISEPAGLALLPDGDALIGSRDTGLIHRVNADTGEITEVGRFQAVAPIGQGGSQGGLLGLAFEGAHVYAYYTTSEDSRIMRSQLRDDRQAGEQLSPAERLLPGLSREGWQNGGPLDIGPDGLLYTSVGGGRDDELADAIVRMTLTGGVPDENAASGSLAYVQAEGVRGLAWDSLGRLWAVDQRGALSVVETGQPDAASPSTVTELEAGVVAGGLAYSQGSLWMPDLTEGLLWRVPLHGPDIAAEPQPLDIGDHGELRAVRSSADGRIWAVGGSSLVVLKVS